MDTLTKTCPRGHILEDEAVLCTVCWVRVAPQDPEVLAARRRRQRRVWIPLFGAGAVLMGVGVGGTVESLLTTTTAPIAVVADEAPAVQTPTVETPTEVVIAAEAPAPEPVAVAVAPLAATVADPVGTTAEACTASLRGQSVECAVSDESLSLTACIPDTAAALAVTTRTDSAGEWATVPATVALGQPSDCAAGTIAADLVLPAMAGSDGAQWRLISTDLADATVWKSRLVTQIG